MYTETPASNVKKEGNHYNVKFIHKYLTEAPDHSMIHESKPQYCVAALRQCPCIKKICGDFRLLNPDHYWTLTINAASRYMLSLLRTATRLAFGIAGDVNDESMPNSS